MYKIAPNIFKIFFLLFLVLFIGFPMYGSGQENTSSESGTSTAPTITFPTLDASPDASSTPQLIRGDVDSDDSSDGSDSNDYQNIVDEGLPEEVVPEPEIIIEEEEIEELEDAEEAADDLFGPVKFALPDFSLIKKLSQPPSPSLFFRKFNKNISIDKNSTHSCLVENFIVDVSNKKSATTNINLHKSDSGDDSYKVEIGALPEGINVVFSGNNDYVYVPGVNESSVGLKITNQNGSQSGSFNVSIIFTKESSATICQLNIVNRV